LSIILVLFNPIDVEIFGMQIVSVESKMLIAKTCEVFLEEVPHLAWLNAKERKQEYCEAI
jgi:hypothetical protein